MKIKTEIKTYQRELITFICDGCGYEAFDIETIFVCDHCDQEVCNGCNENHKTNCTNIYA